MRNAIIIFLSVFVLLSLLHKASAVESLLPFEDSRTHLWGYKNSAGTVIIVPRFSAAESFSNRSIAAVADKSGWMYIDTGGTVLIRPYLFDNGPDPFQEGLARFIKNGKFGFFDESAREIIPAKFDFIFPFSDGRAAFCSGCKEKKEGEHSSFEGGQWGFIDVQGGIVISPKFEKVESFEKGKARVMLNGRWCLIDKQGNTVQ